MVINGQTATEPVEIVAVPLPVSLIDPSRLNRRCNETDDDIAELARTIDEVGLISSITVRVFDAIYNKFEERHEARSRREAAYKCHRCKRQGYMRHPEDGEVLFYCGVPEHLEVHPENPEECFYFWFDRWCGSPPDAR